MIFLHWGSDMTFKKLIPRLITHRSRGLRFGLAMSATIAATACAPSPEPTHKTVEYYRANKEAREARVAECANDPGALGVTPDCINAKQAAAIEDIGNLRDLPPMGLLKDQQEPPRDSSSDDLSRPENSGKAPTEPHR